VARWVRFAGGAPGRMSQALDSEQAGDVAGVALDLIEQAILALDAVELRKAR
jgi:hypothetical protein